MKDSFSGVSFGDDVYQYFDSEFNIPKDNKGNILVPSCYIGSKRKGIINILKQIKYDLEANNSQVTYRRDHEEYMFYLTEYRNNYSFDDEHNLIMPDDMMIFKKKK